VEFTSGPHRGSPAGRVLSMTGIANHTWRASVFTRSHNYSVNEMGNNELSTEKGLVVYYKILFQRYLSGEPVSGPMFEPGTFLIRNERYRQMCRQARNGADVTCKCAYKRTTFVTLKELELIYRMRCAGHVARMRDNKCIQNLIGSMKGTNHSEDLVVNGKIILEWILGK
jgi:hypothetical protein